MTAPLRVHEPGTTPAHTQYARLDPGRVAWRLGGGGILLALALAVVGWTIVRFATPSPLTRWEDEVSRWFVARRTPTLDAMTHVGSYLAETVTCIALLVVSVIVLRLWLGRWREPWTVFAAIVGELLVFLAVTALVDRPRPDVPHLDAAPPTSSFPSGHVGAAVALYGCLAVIVLREMRRRALAVAVVTVCCVVPFIVAVSRLYRGMHHVTDVVFGAVGGGLWLLLVLTTLLALPTGRRDATAPPRHEEIAPGSAVA